MALAEGVRFGPLTAVPTPGHAPDHFAFVADRVCFTGDAVLGEGSAFVAPYEGSLNAHLNALVHLCTLDLDVLCPGHGPAIWEPVAKLQECIGHRYDREHHLLVALTEGARSITGAAGQERGGMCPRSCVRRRRSRWRRIWTSSTKRARCRWGWSARTGTTPYGRASPGAYPERTPGCSGRSEGGRGVRDLPAGHRPQPAVGSLTVEDSPFPPIADYGFLSDCHTCALVALDGSVEWMCLPHFDCPSVFAAMLDRGAGRFRVGPYGLYVPAGRRYLPGTNVLETTWMTPQGWVSVVDALTVGEWHDNEEGSSHTRPPTDYDADHLMVRVIECIQGQVQMEMVCEPMLDYGANGGAVERGRGGPAAGRRGRGVGHHQALDANDGRRCSACSPTCARGSRATACTRGTR